jgi:hypothetical protein
MRRFFFALAMMLPSCGAANGKAPTTATTPTSNGKACSDADHRSFDFWIGDWDLSLRARRGVASEEWDEAKATNEIRTTYGGCVIEEHFRAEGPGEPWSGHSVSTFTDHKWRQTWVDDQGSYMLFVGARTASAMILEGEPKERDGRKYRMRMTFDTITATSLTWKWQRTEDEGASWRDMMVIEYRRRSGSG